ncbi:MAG: PTS glucose transporter subunit IIA [Oscillospiraceae bacterium]|jgi:glucose-specific phosphotransferase system IIA component|nr:PTS glucose transporter subunit IIA [Oscillospiraceae bacterium]MBQ2144639.1 PTS glucose transporter subunit IIA [Oscillospiraceae bacterium]MBQ2328262.1 PTS glucose transporter subunit IIA [Oscillospiraceae bacterium]MBQ4301581.1 PTS glucose transporter subunit IIA [Oscillospiraceae bacterium]MBQ5467323.1 PTS glucose transporter subunit IIA [Oscillospiraceae bacterium]
MGLFDKFKKKAEPVVTFPLTLDASARGTAVEMADIPDPVFSSGAMGEARGVKPAVGEVYAPIGGKITQLAETGHAIGIEADGGLEVLIHVGVDTVAMNGEGFRTKVRQGDRVEKGSLLLTMDLDAIAKAGHSDVVITCVVNSDDFASVEPTAEIELAPGVGMLVVNK